MTTETGGDQFVAVHMPLLVRHCDRVDTCSHETGWVDRYLGGAEALYHSAVVLRSSASHQRAAEVPAGDDGGRKAEAEAEEEDRGDSSDGDDDNDPTKPEAGPGSEDDARDEEQGGVDEEETGGKKRRHTRGYNRGRWTTEGNHYVLPMVPCPPASHPMHPDYKPTLEPTQTEVPTLRGAVQKTNDVLVKLVWKRPKVSDPEADENQQTLVSVQPVGAVHRAVDFSLPGSSVVEFVCTGTGNGTSGERCVPTQSFPPKRMFPPYLPQTTKYNFQNNQYTPSAIVRRSVKNVELSVVDMQDIPTHPPLCNRKYIEAFVTKEERHVLQTLLDKQPIWQSSLLIKELNKHGITGPDATAYLTRAATYCIGRGPYFRLRLRFGYNPHSLPESAKGAADVKANTELMQLALEQRMSLRLSKHIQHWCSCIDSLDKRLVEERVAKPEHWSEAKLSMFHDIVEGRRAFFFFQLRQFEDKHFVEILRAGLQPKCDTVHSHGWFTKTAFSTAGAYFVQELTNWLQEVVIPPLAEYLPTRDAAWNFAPPPSAPAKKTQAVVGGDTRRRKRPRPTTAESRASSTSSGSDEQQLYDDAGVLGEEADVLGLDEDWDFDVDVDDE